MPSLFPSFSHIYVENEARRFPLTDTVLSYFSKATHVDIENYRTFFNQPRQDWRTQKESQKLVLAVKHGTRIHPATEVLPIHSGKPLFYTSPVINCVYDCQYCFLQAMFRSAHMVVFVNEEDFYRDALATAKTTGRFTLSVSYDCDLLGSERFIPWASRWIEFSRKNPDIEIEIRTKSSNYSLIRELNPHPGVILSWSLSTETAWRRYEHKTASPEARIKAATQALEDGWRVRFCFDPVIPSHGWRTEYQAVIDSLMQAIPASAVEDVSVGVFRMGEDHLRNLKARNPSLDLLQTNLETQNGIRSLSSDEHGDVRTDLRAMLEPHFSSNQIVVW